jgi:hypothetical protein
VYANGKLRPVECYSRNGGRKIKENDGGGELKYNSINCKNTYKCHGLAQKNVHNLNFIYLLK